MTLQYSQTKRAWSSDHDVLTGPRSRGKGFGPTPRHEKGFYQEPCALRIVENLYGRAFVRKLRHKRHGQNQAWHIHQMAQRMQSDAEFLKDAANEIQVAVPDLAAIPAFAERYLLWKNEKQDRKLRNMQKKSRKINRH